MGCTHILSVKVSRQKDQMCHSQKKPDTSLCRTVNELLHWGDYHSITILSERFCIEHLTGNN